MLEHTNQFGQGLRASYREIVHAYQTERLGAEFTHGYIPVPQRHIQDMVKQVRTVDRMSGVGMRSANLPQGSQRISLRNLRRGYKEGVLSYADSVEICLTENVYPMRE